MVKYGKALAMLLASASPSCVQSFQSFSSRGSRQHDFDNRYSPIRKDLLLSVSSAQSSSEFPLNSIEEAVSSVTNAAVDTITEAVSTTPDEVETEIDLKKQRVRERTSDRIKTYTVTLPLTKTKATDSSSILSLGLRLSQISKGRVFGTRSLDLDSMKISQIDADVIDATVSADFDKELIGRRLGGDFQGLFVSSVDPGSSADKAGIRVGDVLRATSATLGDQLWPKSTLEGVQSALSTRKAVSGTVQFEFQRVQEDIVDNQFELTLTRPLGIQMKETEDGYVEVTGFTENAPKVVTYAVKVGDRVLAVDSSLGDRMWPVSTVEGVISAVTSRLPGQTITMRFERRDLTVQENDIPSEAMTSRSANVLTESVTVTRTVDDNELLERCRTILKRYMYEQQQRKEQQVNYVEKFAVPALVADKVLYVLENAGATVDSVTLSMIMSAYLSCRQLQSAIRAFEAIVGLKADGSSQPVAPNVLEEDRNRFPVNQAALNVYTATSLLKAHAIQGDLASVKRVLKALEGQSGINVDGLEVASWPGTGTQGTVKPDSQCYNIAMSAAATSRAEEGLALALDLFESMSEPGDGLSKNEKPSKDLVSYNTILSALVQARRYSEAIDVFYETKKSGLKPDKYSYTALVRAVAAEGDVEELLYDMRENGVQPDVVTYNSIIMSLCEEKKFQEARKLVNIMEASGVKPSSKTYGILMNGLLKSGNPRACIILFEGACADRRSVSYTENVYLYTTAIAAASALGDYERALDLVSRMRAIGIKPNLKTLTAVIGACLASGKPSIAAEIYRKIENPDAYAMSQGLRAFARSGAVQEAFEILSTQSPRSRLLDSKQLMLVYKELLEASLSDGNFELAREIFLDLSKKGNIPSKAVYVAIYEAMNLYPTRMRKLGLAPADEQSLEKFAFLLFMLDHVQQRKLPCESHLYASILRYGARTKGLPRKLAELMLSVRRSAVNAAVSIASPTDGANSGEPEVTHGWEELFENYDDFKSNHENMLALPNLRVRVAARDAMNVRKAEQALSYAELTGVRRVK